ncbi:hypothetical protein [[Mycoplasma] mobile]|nr:hypothetical protein [[Mycoplasma] mobile]
MKINNEIKDLREIDVYDENGKKLKGIVLFTFEEAGDTFICYTIKEEVFFSKLNEDNSLSNLEEDEYKIVEQIWEDFIQSDKFKELAEKYNFEGIGGPLVDGGDDEDDDDEDEDDEDDEDEDDEDEDDDEEYYGDYDEDEDEYEEDYEEFSKDIKDSYKNLIEKRNIIN